MEDLPLYEIRKHNPELEKLFVQRPLRMQRMQMDFTAVQNVVKNHSKVYFQVDHIIPMNAGGKSVAENLQILCRQCNGVKGDR